MADPRQQDESEPISEQRLKALVKKLLDTPPRPRGAQQNKTQHQPVAKPEER